MSAAWHGLLFALAVGASAGVGAQSPAEPTPGGESSPQVTVDAPREGMARFFDPEDQQFDLSYFLENPRGFLPIPIVITEPAIGYGGGVAGMFLRPRTEAGSEGWSRPDISGVGGFGTENGTWGAFAGDASRWIDGRLKTLAGVGTGSVNLDFYGLGTDLPALDRGCALLAAVQRRHGPGQLAARAEVTVVARLALCLCRRRSEAARRRRLPRARRSARVKISAPTAIVEFDTRDNVFTPTTGLYAESSYLASREALGSSDNFERFEQL